MSKRIRSDVWKYFTKISDKKAKCLVCMGIYASSGNTSNLKDHLQRAHKREYADLMGAPVEDQVLNTEQDDDLVPDSGGRQPQVGQSHIPQLFASMNAYAASGTGTKTENALKALLFFVTKDCMPLNVVEGEGFVNFIRTIEPKLKLPGRKALTKMLDEKFLEKKDAVKRSISDVPWVTLTTDIWTDTMNVRGYIGVTAHFIVGVSMQSLVLSVKEMKTAHTASEIQLALEAVLCDWEIRKEKVVACVTDGGANIVKAIRDTFGQNKHLFCFAHTLNLVARESMDASDVLVTLLSTIKEIVTFFKKSVKGAEKLREVQIRAGRKANECVKLIQDVKTRWNYTFYMLQRFVDLHTFIVAACVELDDGPTAILSRNDMSVIKDSVEALKPLEAVTKEVSAEMHVTISKLIPLVRCMTNAITHLSLESNTGRELQKHLLQNLAKRFGAIESVKLVAVSTILDPRFKRLHFTSPRACSQAITVINMEVQGLERQSSSSRAAEPTLVSSETSSIWSFHDQLASGEADNQETSLGFSPSLKQYLKLPLIARHEDPIKFWDTNKLAFPDLFSLSRKYFSIVGTSVPSERLFSKAGNTMTEKRNRFDPKRLEKLIFLGNISIKNW